MPIAWTNFPVAAGYTPGLGVNLYVFLIQLWRALRERAWGVGSEFWPRTSLPYDTDASVSYARAPGYTAIADTVTASGSDYVVNFPGKAWSANRWFGAPPDPDYPDFYDLLVEVSELDPWQVLRAPIVAQPATDQLKLAGAAVDDFFTAWAPTLAAADITGKRCIIEKRDEGGHRSVHWHDRWLEHPNATPYASGQCTVFAANTIEDLAAHMLIAPATGLGKWVGKQLIVSVDVGSGVIRLKRFTVTAHTAKRVTVTVPGGWTLQAGEYALVDVNAKWAPGRTKAPAFAWYRGIRGHMTGFVSPDPRYWTHSRDVSIGMEPTPVAAMTVKTSQLDETGTICVDTEVDAMHEDLWSRTPPADPYNPDRCDAADRPYAPDLYKSPSALQAELESRCMDYVNRRVNWHGANVRPQNFVPATLFKAMNATAYGRTLVFTVTINSAVASGNGIVTFSPITLPADVHWDEIAGLPVHYAILTGSQQPLPFGYSYPFRTQHGAYPALCGFLVGLGQLNLREATYSEQSDPDPAAWPYPLTQPKMNEFVGKTLVIAFGWDRTIERQVRYLNPETALMDGTTTSYATRAASTSYCESTVRGTTADTGIAFKPGEFARYVGDRWYDPTTTVPYTGGGPPDLAESTDRFFTEARPRKYGSATDAGSYYIRDETRSLDGDTPDRALWTAGVARSETFTASSGGNTTVANAGGDPTYWGGGDGRMVGFVIEVQDTDGVWHKRPVTAYNAGTKTLTVSPAFPFTTSGKNARLREPFNVNTYAGPYRTLVFWVNGTLYMPVVLSHDDDTFFFADIGVPIPPGTMYTTDEPRPGEVVQYVAASGPTPAHWQRPQYGPDPRGGNHPILSETRANVPTLVRRFGRLQRDDLITDKLLNQLYAAVNEITDYAGGAFWDRSSPNQKTSGFTLIDEPYSQDKLQNAIVANWAAATAFNSDALDFQYPFALATFQSSIIGSATAAWFDAVIATAPTVRIAWTTDAYAYTSTDPNDYGIYSRLDVPLGAPDINQYFRAHGSGALYRRWSKIGHLAAGIHPTISVRVGDRGGADSLQNCPTDWPPAAGDEYPDTLNSGWWSVALQNGTEDPSPVNVLGYGVEGGFGYRDTGTGALLPLPGAGMSGLPFLGL